MGKTKMKGAQKMDPQKVTEWFMKLMEGAKKGLDEFTDVAKETTFEVRIISDENGIGFEADLNIVQDYERDEAYRDPVEAEDIPEGADADDYYKELVKKALKEANGNIQKAADILGISKQHLKSQLAKWNL